MKIYSAILAMLLLCITAKGQTERDEQTGISAEFAGGIASNSALIGRMSLGAVTCSPVTDVFLHPSINLQFFNVNSIKVPVITEFRLGAIYDTWEVYAGPAYHYATSDYDKFKVNGWRSAIGLVKHFRGSPFTVTAGKSGNIYSLQIGIACIR